MGLACPVCEVPHPDGEHLADHVAITATTRDGDHRAWLDEHAPDWESMTRIELGELVTDRAEEVDSIDLHEEIKRHESHGHDHGAGVAEYAGRGDLPLDEDAQAIVAEARAMADRRLGGDDHDDGDDADADDSGTDEPNGTDARDD